MHTETLSENAFTLSYLFLLLLNKFNSPLGSNTLNMKYKKVLQIAVVMAFIFTLYPKMIFGQKPEFFPADERAVLTIKFHSVDTVIVAVPDFYVLNKKDSSAIESYVFWGKKPVYTYKKESELTQEDFKKHIQVYGPFAKFSCAELLKIPIRQSVNGFKYRGRVFDNPLNSMTYINDSATLFYTCKNSDIAENVHRSHGSFAYQLYISHNNELIYTGTSSDLELKESINDMDRFRADYFRSKQSRYCHIYVAKTMNCDSIFNILPVDLDGYIDNLCHHLKVDTKNIGPIITYFYADRIGLQQFTAQPFWSTVYGKSFGNINHIAGLSLETFKHETAHTIIGKKIGGNANPFFMEGFAQYTSYLVHDSTYAKELAITKENLMLLTPELVNDPGNSFYNNMNNYSIAGVFTKFLIGKTGLSDFKSAYSNNTLDKCLKEHYNSSLEKAIAEFKEQCQNNLL